MPINYIVMDRSDDTCIETAEAYVDFFERNRMPCQKVPILSEEQFTEFFRKLEYGFVDIS